MSDFNIQFEEQDQSITLEFEQIGGGAVKSVNGKTGAVVLDAGDLEYDDTKTYPSGSVGDALNDLKEESSQILNSAYVTDTASGSIASFPDGADGVPVKSLTVDIEPVQDLHGYDNPWPSGGGKNIYNNEAGNASTNGVTFTKRSDGTIALSNTATSNAFYNMTNRVLPAGTYIANGCPANGSQNTYALNIYNETTSTTISGGDVGSGKEFTANGTDTYRLVIRINSGTNTNGLIFKPMIRLSSISDATYAPYENICPISGHTSAKVTRTGKNLLKSTATELTTNGITFTPNEDGSFSVTGTATENAYFNIRSWVNVSVAGLPINVPLAISGGTTQVRFTVAYRDSDERNAIEANDEGHGATVTIPSTDKTVYIALRVASGVTVDATVYPMIRPESDTDATFATYQGQTVTIDLDGTRYGGSLDVTTGQLVVTHGYVDLGSLNYIYQTTAVGHRFYVKYLNAKPASSNTTLANIFCSRYPIITASKTWNDTKIGIGISTASEILIVDDAYTDASSFKTAMSGTQLVYELTTNQVIQLTPTEVRTLLATNNIWTSTNGDSTVSYRADTKLYINKMLNA